MSLLLSRLRGWDADRLLEAEPPVAGRAIATPSRASTASPAARLQSAIDGCGIETYAFHLREVARAYAMLADPAGIPAAIHGPSWPARSTTIRDAMLANPEMVAGRHDRLDTSLMKAAPGRLVSKAGMEALRAIAILPGARSGTNTAGASGMAIKIEDGDASDRGTWAATVEALRQAGVARRRVAARPGPLSPAGGSRPARPGRGRDGPRVRARTGG